MEMTVAGEPRSLLDPRYIDAPQQRVDSEMSTAFISHPDCLKHDMGRHHPEQPARLQAIEDRLIASGQAYGCACTRAEIAAAAGLRPKHGELVYPGTCRHGTNGRPVRAWRFRVAGRVDWQDRRLGAQSQDLETEVGVFPLCGRWCGREQEQQ